MTIKEELPHLNGDWVSFSKQPAPNTIVWVFCPRNGRMFLTGDANMWKGDDLYWRYADTPNGPEFVYIDEEVKNPI